MNSLDELGLQLDGVREGDSWRCHCPVCGGHGLLITASRRSGKILYYCWSTGCPFREIVRALRENRVEPETRAPFDGRHNGEDESQRLKIEVARRLLRRTECPAGTIVEAYLARRAITITVPPALRFMSYCPHRCGRSFPALVAAVVDLDGETVGYHATFLAPDGAGKYPFPSKALQRECRGRVRGGSVRLAVAHPDRELCVREGVESVLSAMQLFGLPGWAALSASGLVALELPSEVRRIVIAVDNDANGAGQAAALSAYHGWRAEGRSVRFLIPPKLDTDFNDVLMRVTR
jgi:putative DNA primase/helicase